MMLLIGGSRTRVMHTDLCVYGTRDEFDSGSVAAQLTLRLQMLPRSEQTHPSTRGD